MKTIGDNNIIVNDYYYFTRVYTEESNGERTKLKSLPTRISINFNTTADINQRAEYTKLLFLREVQFMISPKERMSWERGTNPAGGN